MAHHDKQFIKWMQQRLGLKVTGKDDAALHQAILAYQTSLGLSPTSTSTQETVDALRAGAKPPVHLAGTVATGQGDGVGVTITGDIPLRETGIPGGQVGFDAGDAGASISGNIPLVARKPAIVPNFVSDPNDPYMLQTSGTGRVFFGNADPPPQIHDQSFFDGLKRIHWGLFDSPPRGDPPNAAQRARANLDLRSGLAGVSESELPPAPTGRLPRGAETAHGDMFTIMPSTEISPRDTLAATPKLHGDISDFNAPIGLPWGDSYDSLWGLLGGIGSSIGNAIISPAQSTGGPVHKAGGGETTDPFLGASGKSYIENQDFASWLSSLAANLQGGGLDHHSESQLVAAIQNAEHATRNNSASAARGIRNNNPGNIEYGNFARAHGSTGPEAKGRFATFSDPVQGLAAIAALQHSYENRGWTTVADRIAHWAPASENNTAAYARSVAKSMGISPDQSFSITDPVLGPAFISAMVKVENGSNPYSTDQIKTAWDSAVTGPQIGAPSPQAAPTVEASLSGYPDRALQSQYTPKLSDTISAFNNDQPSLGDAIEGWGNTAASAIRGAAGQPISLPAPSWMESAFTAAPKWAQPAKVKGGEDIRGLAGSLIPALQGSPMHELADEAQGVGRVLGPMMRFGEDISGVHVPSFDTDTYRTASAGPSRGPQTSIAPTSFVTTPVLAYGEGDGAPFSAVLDRSPASPTSGGARRATAPTSVPAGTDTSLARPQSDDVVNDPSTAFGFSDTPDLMNTADFSLPEVVKKIAAVAASHPRDVAHAAQTQSVNIPSDHHQIASSFLGNNYNTSFHNASMYNNGNLANTGVATSTNGYGDTVQSWTGSHGQTVTSVVDRNGNTYGTW